MTDTPFTSPPGFDDLDAECFGPAERSITAGGLTLWTQPVIARDIGMLSRILQPRLEMPVRDAATRDFLADHLDEDSYARMLMEMISPSWSRRTLGDVLTGICLRDTARPWKAFGSLVITTSREWRIIRGRLIACGVTDPLALPSIHALLDYVEWIVTENMTEDDREGYTFRMYAPEPGTVPEGWSAEEQLASFAAFESAFGDGK